MHDGSECVASLTGGVKAYIVQRLACYDTPQQVTDAVKEEFGLTVSRQLVQTYDAGRAGRKPAEKWRALFEATRPRFLKSASEIPAAQKAVRLRRLDRMAARAEERGDYALAARLLE